MADEAKKTFRGILGGGAWFNEDSAKLIRRAFEKVGASPRLGVIPTPLSSLPCEELDGIREQFGKDKSSFRTLTETTQDMPNRNEAEDLLGWANVVLIMGGNYAEQMQRWQTTGIDHFLLAAADTGTYFVGASTGFICWTKAAQTRNRPFGAGGDSKEDLLVNGLGKLPVLACAHYDNFQSSPTGPVPRSVTFTNMMKEQPIGTVGIGATNFGYFDVDGDTVEIDRTNRYASIHRVERTDTEFGLDIQQYGPGTKLSYAEFFGA